MSDLGGGELNLTPTCHPCLMCVLQLNFIFDLLYCLFLVVAMHGNVVREIKLNQYLNWITTSITGTKTDCQTDFFICAFVLFIIFPLITNIQKKKVQCKFPIAWTFQMRKEKLVEKINLVQQVDLLYNLWLRHSKRALSPMVKNLLGHKKSGFYCCIIHSSFSFGMFWHSEREFQSWHLDKHITQFFQPFRENV